MRRAVHADLGALADTLAAAFEGEPWTAWTVERDDRRRRLAGLFRLYASADALAHGEVWVSPGGEAVAMWQPPGHRGPGDEVLERLEPVVARLHGDRLAAAEAANGVLAALRPAAEHWYLPLVGTRPGHRRAGLGSAVLAPVLARADAAGLPAVADAADPAAVAFLARQGFAVAAEVDVPGGGPHVWLLVRPPDG